MLFPHQILPQFPFKNKFIYPKMSPKSYNVQGDCRQLEFSVELAFLGHSSSISALNFDDFLRKRQKDGARWFEDQNAPLAPENEEKGILLERRTIRWQQPIPRPTTFGGELGARGMDEEGENEEGGVEEEEEDENEEEEDEGEVEGKEEKVPDDPSQRQIVPKSGNRGQKRRISHRIFTLLEPIGVGMDGQGEHINGQRPAGQHFPRKQRNGQIEQTALKEPIRMQQSAQRQKRFVPISADNMRIMAYLGEDSANEYDQSEEWFLWEISLQNGRLLRVDPDFGQRTISSRTGTFLATLSFNEAIQFDELGEQRDLEEADEGELGAAAFEVPKGNGEYWLHYLVEIAKARNFPGSGDNLRVEWQLEMPENVQLIQPAMARGQTQQCGTKASGRDDIAQIGHLFQFTLAYNSTTIQSESEEARAADWPMCLFRVISEDSWARFFVDGYACLPLPSNPGQQNISLDCWRPIDGEKSKICALKNAHLGQSVDLRHFGLAGPRDANGNWSPSYSREGLATEGTGQLELVIRCLHQSKHFISRDVLSSLKYTKMVQRSGLNGGLHWRIAKVLEEFERARRQLMALRARKAKKQMGILQIQKEIE